MNERAASASCSSVSEVRSAAARPGGDLTFGLLGDRNLVFSEARQAVYELNDIAAHVWPSLDSGMSAAQVVRELIGSGVERDQAAIAVDLAAVDMRTMGEAAAASPPASLREPAERLTRLTILVVDVAVQLNLSKALARDVEGVFGHLLTDRRDSDCVLCARVAGNTVEVFSPGEPDWSCHRRQFIPLLKAKLIECVLQCARYEVALHAAAIARDKGAMLLMGSPGAGKTTLAIALRKSGLEVLADDVVLLDEDGLISGLSLPFTAKSTSWDLLSHRWPGIADYPSHCRPDGQTLCYIPLDRVRDPRPRKISLVVILNRQDNSRTHIEELDLICALAALVEEGATRDERLSSSGFSALAEGLREARCCRLTYCDLAEAAEVLCSFDP